MNSNNWLAFPLSPSHSPLPLHQSANQFPLGLMNDNLNSPLYQHDHEWNLMDPNGDGNDGPKVADFLGVSKLEHQQDLVGYNNEMHGMNETNYLFSANDLLQPAQNAIPDALPLVNYETLQENSSNNLQSALTLSMGSSGKGSLLETSVDTSSTGTVEATPRRALDTFGQRTSIYRGVTRHRWTGRYEAHLWDNSCRREGQSRKGRQVYLGGYDKEDKAARAYDMAALKYWGTSTTTNFPISIYEKEVEDMKNMTRQEFVASIRRKSSGFSRGASQYRGVTRHHQHGRWQARIGRVAGNKDLYLGTFSTEEEAAEAYDIAAIKFRGLNAVTNFDMNRYDVKSILESNTLPIGGGAAKRLKEAHALETSRKREEMIGALTSSLHYGGGSSSSTTRLPQSHITYPLLQQSPYDHQTPILTLQNQDLNSHHHQYLTLDSGNQFYQQSYLQTQLQLHQQPQFYNTNSTTNYLQNNPLLHGMMSMDSNGSNNSNGSYNNEGYLGHHNGLSGMAVSSTNPGDELSLVKVDYDMQSGGGYGDWTTSGNDSVQGSNAGVFSMWND